MRREEKRRRIIQKDLKRVSRNITQRALLLKSGFLQSLMRNCSRKPQPRLSVLVVVAVWSVVARCAGSSCVKTRVQQRKQGNRGSGIGDDLRVLGFGQSGGYLGFRGLLFSVD